MVKSKIKKEIVLLIQPNIILFLSSEKYSKHITGEIITVAGGMEGRLLHNANDIDPKSVLSV